VNVCVCVCLSRASCCYLFLVHLNTPEPQTASGLHCYPASFAKHHGRLLEAGVRLQLLFHCNAQRDGRNAGKKKKKKMKKKIGREMEQQMWSVFPPLHHSSFLCLCIAVLYSCVCSTGQRRAHAAMVPFKWSSYQQTSMKTSSTGSSGSATWPGYVVTVSCQTGLGKNVTSKSLTHYSSQANRVQSGEVWDGAITREQFEIILPLSSCSSICSFLTSSHLSFPLSFPPLASSCYSLLISFHHPSMTVQL